MGFASIGCTGPEMVSLCGGSMAAGRRGQVIKKI
jgi:hypothetical protein